MRDRDNFDPRNDARGRWVPGGGPSARGGAEAPRPGAGARQERPQGRDAGRGGMQGWPGEYGGYGNRPATGPAAPGGVRGGAGRSAGEAPAGPVDAGHRDEPDFVSRDLSRGYLGPDDERGWQHGDEDAFRAGQGRGAPASGSYGGRPAGSRTAGFGAEPADYGNPAGEADYGAGGQPQHGWGKSGGTYGGDLDPGRYGGPFQGRPSVQSGQRRGPKGWKRSDERIREDICERLSDMHDVDASDVSVEVAEGVVTLEGTVPERQMKHQIENLVDGSFGVQDIHNRIRVRREGMQAPATGAGMYEGSGDLRGEQPPASQGGLLSRLFGFRAGTSVADLMTRDVQTVAPDDTLDTAARLMKSSDVGALPVCQDGTLMGMLTDRDITVRAVAEGKAPAATRVSDVMTGDVHSCLEGDSIDEVLDRMGDLQVRRIPVVDDAGRLAGIVSLGDFAVDRTGDVDDALQQISEPTRR